MQKLLLLILTGFAFSADALRAQTTIPGTFSTPRGNIKTQHTVYTGQHTYPMLKLSKKKRFSPKDKYEIRIVLKTDSVIITSGKLVTANGIQTITYDSAKTITPADTKEIVFPVLEGEFLKGIPRDTCWIFKTTSGSINAYAATPDVDTKDIIAIQKLTGEIVSFSKELLLQWLKLDNNAVKLAEKGKYLEAIKMYNQ